MCWRACATSIRRPVWTLQAVRPQQRAEVDQVFEERYRAAWAISSASLVAADGVDVFARLQQDAQRVVGSGLVERSRSSATSAETQSSVSDTPGSL